MIRRFNKKHGYGIMIYAQENQKYVGIKLLKKDLLTCIGHWQDNLYHGEGTLYYPDGSYFTGTNKKDSFKAIRVIFGRRETWKRNFS